MFSSHMLSSAFDKAKLFAENLMTHVSIYLVSFLELTWNCIILM